MKRYIKIKKKTDQKIKEEIQNFECVFYIQKLSAHGPGQPALDDPA